MKKTGHYITIFILAFATFSIPVFGLEIDEAFIKLSGTNKESTQSQNYNGIYDFSEKYSLRNLKPNRDFNTNDLNLYFQKHFILYQKDADYGAHFPTYSEYFSHRLQINAQPKNFFNRIIVEEDNAFNLAVLSPDYLYQIDYLIASKGKGLMSGFGHSMVRLVFCDPTRSTKNGTIIKDEKCLNDHNFHMVVSFRAQIKEFSINGLKGIMGGYPSRLFIIPFNQIKKEYNQLEFRDLLAFKLNLNDEKKQRFLARVMELYWTYQGDYKFLSNNCAVEILNLIRSVLWDSKIELDNKVKPYGVLDELQKKKLISNKSLTFESYEKDYNRYLEYVNEASGLKLDIKKYSELKADKRDEIIRETVQKALYNETDTKERLKIISALILLEKMTTEIVIGKSQALIPKLIKERKINAQNLKPITEFLEIVDNFNLAEKNSYGIPSQAQLISIDEFNIKLDRITVSFGNLKKFIIQSIPDLKTEMDIINNLMIYLEQTKKTIRSER